MSKKLFSFVTVAILSVALSSAAYSQDTEGARTSGTTATTTQNDDDEFDMGWLGLLGLLGLAGLIPRKRHDDHRHTTATGTATRT